MGIALRRNDGNVQWRWVLSGGIDAQKLLVKSNPAVIRNEVSKIKKLFKKNTGIILGPSHYLTNDIPLENILAAYK